MTDYRLLDVLAMARLVKFAHISERELLLEAQARLARFNPALSSDISSIDASWKDN